MVEFTDTGERFELMLEEATMGIREEFLLLVDRMRETLDVETLAEMLGSGRFEQAFDDIGRVSASVGNVYPRHYAAAGEATARWLTETVDDIILGFDMTNNRAVLNLRNSQFRLVQAFIDAQRRASTAAIVGVIQDDENAGGAEMAAALIASIGLTTAQYESLVNYRRLLIGLDGDALRRALRDPDMDAEVSAAISSRTPLTTAQVDQMVEAYRKNLLNYRATVIGRTEALSSTSAGRREAYQQAIEQGQLAEESLTRVWNTASDERVRGSHKAMQGQQRTFGAPFLSGLGNLLRFPGDPSAPPADRLQCRCTESTIISFPAV